MVEFVVVFDIDLKYDENSEYKISAEGISNLEEVCRLSDGLVLSSLLGGICRDASASQAIEIIGGLKSFFSERGVRVYSVMDRSDACIPKHNFMNAFGSSPRYRAVDVFDYRFIFLDTLISNPEAPYSFDDADGRHCIDEEQLMWLSRLLERSHRRAVIISDVPIFLPDDMNGPCLENGKELRGVLEKSNKCALVVSRGDSTEHHFVSNSIPYIFIPHNADGFSCSRVSASSQKIDVTASDARNSFTMRLAHEESDNQKVPFLKRLFGISGK